MKKRVLSLLMSVVMLVSLLPATARAAENEEDGLTSVTQAEIPGESDVSGDVGEKEGSNDPPQQAPRSITVVYEGDQKTPDGKLIGKNGDAFQFKAYDENEQETPVTWKNGSTWCGSLDENGVFTASSLSRGGTSYLYITAVSKLDPAVSSKATKFEATGYSFSDSDRDQTVALSEDGQRIKTISIIGGQSGYNEWSCNIPDGIAALAEEPGSGGTIKLNALRPGTAKVSFKLTFNERMTDTATVRITGVAVEDPDGTQGKTYLTKTTEQPSPAVQLTAYMEEERTADGWASSDETVAMVDESGLVTAVGIGTAQITVTDSEGTKGGIKVVVQDGETPYFENLQFMANAIKDYSTDYRFKPTQTEYTLDIKAYGTSTLSIQNTTIFDAKKYTAAAEYTDVDGVKQTVAVASGKVTALPGIPFDNSDVVITLADKENAANRTDYIFHVTRPRDTTKVIKSNSIVLVPDGRGLLTSKYNGQAEGTMFKADETGLLTSGTGVSGTQYFYRTYALDGLERFALTLTASTAYAHLRYSTDDETWTELAQGGGTTDKLNFPAEGEKVVRVQIKILDDKTYSDNVKAGKDGFEGAEPVCYTVWVEQAAGTTAGAQLLTAAAEVDGGDWYPAFSKDVYSYTIVVPNGTTAGTLTYTAAEGAAVKLGSDGQTPDENGRYTLPLKTSAQTLTVTSADGTITNSYSFKLTAKSKYAVPDKVVDYLCIGSQYTNGAGWGGFGIAPEATLAASLRSLGNFGGYITYYYENGLKDDPNNRYGVDFYVYGNSSENNQASMAELGQVYVSEDGQTWYALAGSEHYEDKAIWDYTIDYVRTADGKSTWTDDQGDSMISAAAVAWPDASKYYFNDVGSRDSYRFTGILFKSQEDGTVMGTSSNSSFAAAAKFGYADYYANGTMGADVNPYMADPTKNNGFDLAWAVDSQGDPVDVSGKEFHYVKVATASNIWAGSFKEKSTEVTAVVRTTAQDTAVGKTALPNGVTISDGASSKTVLFADGQNIYDVALGDMKYVSISVNGAGAEDNIYINNQRVPAGEQATGFKVTAEGQTLVRIIVQNDEKEPAICLLRLTSSASAEGELIEGVKAYLEGVVRQPKTTDGLTYETSVGYRISSVRIVPVAAPDVTLSINGEAAAESYALSEGDNLFTITGEKDGQTYTVTLKITRAQAPTATGKIKVSFTLKGDSKHGESDDVHTLKNGGLETWIARTSYEIDAPATVLDVLTKALDGKYDLVNAGGNYISEIGGLAEFDNGRLSGWMFTLNGVHGSLGVDEQTVSSGDVIVFHYTDDYTKEQGSEQWGGSSHAEKPAENDTFPFTDVVDTSWFYAAVQYVWEKGLMTGMDGKTFSPESTTTRAQLVTILWQLAGCPDSESGAAYSDTQVSAWYAKAVAWAGANGIVSGYADGSFGPDDAVTREQFAAILYRYAQSLGEGFTGSWYFLLDYSDAQQISAWADEAMHWCVMKGILSGTGADTLSPGMSTTRGQMAVMLMQFCQRNEK